MSKANVLVFNHEQLDERYHYSTQNNRTARLVKEALSRDYQIALVHKDGLSSAKWLTYDVQIALELSVEHSSTVHIWTYIEPLDMTDPHKKDQVVVAFKEFKGMARANACSPEYHRISDDLINYKE